jgi:hypothetical protein
MAILLTRDAILGAMDIRQETVHVPEWGGDVQVRGMTGGERDALEDAVVTFRRGKKEVDLRKFRARMVAICVVGEDGQQLFSADDVDGLAEKSAVALVRVFDVANRLSGLNAEDVEELVKN